MAGLGRSGSAAAADPAPAPGLRRTRDPGQQRVDQFTDPSSEAVTYGGHRDVDLLRQIAEASRTSAQAQVELLRQQQEIIRLLDELVRRQPSRR